MTRHSWKRLTAILALLLMGVNCAGALMHQHGPGQYLTGWDFHHFPLLPCEIPAGLKPLLALVCTHSEIPQPAFIQAFPSQHSSRAPPA